MHACTHRCTSAWWWVKCPVPCYFVLQSHPAGIETWSDLKQDGESTAVLAFLWGHNQAKLFATCSIYHVKFATGNFNSLVDLLILTTPVDKSDKSTTVSSHKWLYLASRWHVSRMTTWKQPISSLMVFFSYISHTEASALHWDSLITIWELVVVDLSILV